MKRKIQILQMMKIRKAVHRPDDPVQAYGVLLDAPTRRDLDVAIVSIFVGILFTIITGFPGASPLFTAFLKEELGISNSAYGLILTIPYVTVLIQLPYSAYVRRHGRIKQTFILFALLNKLSFVAPALMALTMKNASPALSTLIIGAVMLFASACNWIADSALSTWFGAMIPNAVKGRYLSTRQMLYTIAALGYSLLLGLVLRFMDSYPHKYTLFFLLASLTGVIDILIYLGARPPEQAFEPWHPDPTAPALMSAADFLKPFRNPTYRAYLLFATCWSFAINLTAPYFNVYMLQELHISLGIQTLLQQILPYIATILFMRRIGRLNDSFGFKPMLTLSCWIVAFMPLSWVFSTPDSYWFIGVTNFLSGIFNVAIDLAIMSLAIFLAPHQDRATYLAGKNISISLLGIVPAILIGGKLTDLLDPILSQAPVSLFAGHRLSSFHVLLVLSCLIRLSVIVFFLSKMKEENAPQISLTIRELNSMARFSVNRKISMLREMVHTIGRRLRRPRDRG